MSFLNLELLNKDYVLELAAGQNIEVEEKSVGGAGVCTFRASTASLLMRAKNQSPVVWALKNRKCAEAAFVTLGARQEFRLHIVEMKSTLSTGDFQKVIEQWKGMYLSALSVLGVLKAPVPIEVIVYIAFREDRVAQPDPTQIVMQKTLVGGGLMPAVNEWVAGRVDLYHGISARIVKGVRTPDNVDFGIV